MARSKKSRKVGKIGVSSVPKAERKPKVSKSAGRPKKTKGNPAGSRHSAEQSSSLIGNQTPNSDPRIGSKKPIPLVVEAKITKPAKKSYFSPAQELKVIEDDPRLADLLDKLDDGSKLTPIQKSYVEEKMQRHKVLCELLGIDVDEESSDTSDEETTDDPYERFNTIDINKFK